jgi:hypothetical protein
MANEAGQVEVKYVGPHDIVEVPRPDGSAPKVIRGERLLTTPEHAVLLLEQQSNWEPVEVLGKRLAKQAGENVAAEAERIAASPGGGTVVAVDAPAESADAAGAAETEE